jgi:hypothetical protein
VCRDSCRASPRLRAGPHAPSLVDASLRYTVPAGASTQSVYLRGGNSSKEMVYVVLVRDGAPMRYLPLAVNGSTHASLRVVEDLQRTRFSRSSWSPPRG